MIEAFKTPNTLAAVIAQHCADQTERDNAAIVSDYLLRENVLIEQDSYLPHTYLNMLFKPSHAGRSEGQPRLEQIAIGLVGSGFLGSRIARELARLRVGRIVLLDERTVGPHDAAYFDIPPTDVQMGRPYVEVVREDLARFGYDDDAVEVIHERFDHEPSLDRVFGQCQFVIAAFEGLQPRALHTLNDFALTIGIPWMSVYADGSEAIIGPIYVPGESAAYDEFEIQYEAALAMRNDYLLYKETLADPAYRLEEHHFVLPPYLNLMQGWAMTALLPFLTTGKSFAVSRCVRVDFERLSVDYVDVLKLPRTPACKPRQPAYRHTYM